MSYSTKEKIDIILIYLVKVFIVKYLREPVRIYSERYSDRNCPSYPTYTKIMKNCCANGNIKIKKRERNKTVTHEKRHENDCN